MRHLRAAALVIGVALAIGCRHDPSTHRPSGCSWQATIGGRGAPRCAADDPTCGPDTLEHDCLDLHDYRRDGRRTPIAEACVSPESCSFDGECFVGNASTPAVASCADGCLSTHPFPPEPPPAPGAPTIDRGSCTLGITLRPDGKRAGWERLCGCVAGRCRWFVP